MLDHPAQREEANPTHTHTEDIKRLTLAAQQAVITLGEKTYKQGEVEHAPRPGLLPHRRLHLSHLSLD